MCIDLIFLPLSPPPRLRVVGTSAKCFIGYGGQHFKQRNRTQDPKQEDGMGEGGSPSKPFLYVKHLVRRKAKKGTCAFIPGRCH